MNAFEKLGSNKILKSPLQLITLTNHENNDKISEIIKSLLTRDDIDVNCQDNINIKKKIFFSNQTPLMLAVEKEYLELFKILINKKDIDVNARNNEGNTILHLASEIKNESFLNEILDNPKIDINIQNNELNTPLHLAILKNNILFVTLLINNEKCNLSLTNNKKMTPLMLAFNISINIDKQFEIVNLFLNLPRDININLKDENGILL